uniref:G_PROTEIN_RECEP_F1_2 domain-containing protein n=1 Tax=Heterorhabditis bacteriophora TaxID=37862 RepID=A0A1I7WAR1_HETBA
MRTIHTFSQTVNGYLTTVCVIVGTIGNMHGVKSVHMTNLDKNRGVVLAVSLLALAFWDTVLLWCAFVYYGIKKLPLNLDTDILNLLTPWFHPFSQIANTASVSITLLANDAILNKIFIILNYYVFPYFICLQIWCVVAITWQRFMATRDPFRTSRSAVLVQSFRSERRISFMYCSTYRRLLRMPFFLSLAAIFLNLPAFFEIATTQCINIKEHRVAIGVSSSDIKMMLFSYCILLL